MVHVLKPTQVLAEQHLKSLLWRVSRASSSSGKLTAWDVNYRGDRRTYCFTTVGYQARGLLESLLEVVSKSLILIFLGTQLEEFT